MNNRAYASFDQSPMYQPGNGDPQNPNVPGLPWYRGELRRRLSRLMMSGSEGMRIAAGSGGPVAYMASSVTSPEYGTLRAMPNVLPIEQGETQLEYQTRRDRSVLAGFFADAIDEHVGRAFHQPPMLMEDVPTFIRGEYEYTDVPVDDGSDTEQEDAAGTQPKVRRVAKLKEAGIWENIDNQGNHGDVFGRRIWADAEIDGVTFVVIEMTPGSKDKNGIPLPQSLADRRLNGSRVYWTQIVATDVIEATPRMCNGSPRLSVWRQRERFVDDLGNVIHRVRKFYDGLADNECSDKMSKGYISQGDIRRKARYELYEEPEEVRHISMDTKDRYSKEWNMIDSGYLTLSFIPVVAFMYGKKIDFFQTEVANGGLAEANALHFRVYSDYLDLLHAACVPMLHRSGWTPAMADPSNPQTTVSSRRMLYSNDPSAKAEWVEVKGTSLERVESSLDRIESRCQALSLEPILQRLGTPTATAEGLKAAKANSRIEGWMVMYKDALETCLDYSAMYEGLGENKGGSVATNKDLGLFLLGGVDANLLVAINAAGKIDDTTLLSEFKRRGILHMDADIGEIIRMARMEAAARAVPPTGNEVKSAIAPSGLTTTAQTEMIAAQGPPIPKGEGDSSGSPSKSPSDNAE